MAAMDIDYQQGASPPSFSPQTKAYAPQATHQATHQSHNAAHHASDPLQGGIHEVLDSMLRLRLRFKGSKCPEAKKAAPRLVTDAYEFDREIGRGHYGSVRICTRRGAKGAERETLACKSILKASIQSAEDAGELCSEILTMLRLRQLGPRPSDTVQLRDAFEDSLAFHLIMDYCPGGDLFDHVARSKRLSERETAQIVCQLALAVQGIHSCGVVHRDLKPENILLASPPKHSGASWQLKVADFGLCVQLGSGQQARGVAGSPFYMAPEVIVGEEYGPEVDVWSLGVIAYTCLAGSLPFFGKSHDAVFAAVCRAPLDFHRKPWPLVSHDAKTLICSMMDRDPKRRARLSDVLLHPWVLRHSPEAAHRRLGPMHPPSTIARKILNFAQGSPKVCPVTAPAPAPASAPAPAPATAPEERKPVRNPSAHAPGVPQAGQPWRMPASHTLAGPCQHQVYSGATTADASTFSFAPVPAPASVAGSPATSAQCPGTPGTPFAGAKAEASCTPSTASSTASSSFFSFPFSPASSSSSTSTASHASFGTPQQSQAGHLQGQQQQVKTARHKIPGGSRKGFSAPLTSTGAPQE